MPEYVATLVARTPQENAPPILEEIDELPYTQLSYERELQTVWSHSAVMDAAAMPTNVGARLKDLLMTPSELWIYRDGVLMAVGPVLGATADEGNITVSAQGVLAYAGFMRRTSSYVTTDDQFQHVVSLIDAYQALTYGDYGIDTSTTDLTSGVTTTLRVVGTENKQLLRLLIDEGASRTDGYDMWVEPTTRKLELASPSKGVDRSTTVFIDARGIDRAKVDMSIGADVIASEVAVTVTNDDGFSHTSMVSNVAVREAFGRAMTDAQLRNVRTCDLTESAGAALLALLGEQLVEVEPDIVPVDDAAVGDFWEGDIVTYAFDAGFGLQVFERRLKKVQVQVEADTEKLGVVFA